MRAKRTRFPAQVAKIGILETAAIGDTTLLSAAIFDLRAAFPAASIVLFAGSSNIGVAKLLAGVDEVVRLPISSPVNACQIVRRYEFDLLDRKSTRLNSSHMSI